MHSVFGAFQTVATGIFLAKQKARIHCRIQILTNGGNRGIHFAKFGERLRGKEFALVRLALCAVCPITLNEAVLIFIVN